MQTTAILVLKDGSIFRGTSIGASGNATGEVVFNTAMTGYQEILTDPSYARQIVTLTYPHIGNTGTNPEDVESIAGDTAGDTAGGATGGATCVHAAGLVIRDLPRLQSNWRSTEALADYLARHNIVAIADVDTRRLTRRLREFGAQAGCIVTGEDANNEQTAQDAVSTFPGLAGMDLAKVVSCKSPYTWATGSWTLEDGMPAAIANPSLTRPSSARSSKLPALTRHVVAMDFGVKTNILRMLVDRGCRLTVIPAETRADAIMALNPDGIFLSNGPGDPEPCDYAIETITSLLTTRIPVFGICLGHQLLALASGANTLKMKFGHHGANHPVQDVTTGKVMISSQNHGFAVDPESLGQNLSVTHISLFDGSLQGIRRNDVPAFSFQGHPEASPGPHDVAGLFDKFIELMKNHQTKAGS